MKLTPAQRWALDAASKGQCLPAGYRQVHTSFMTGEKWFGVPWRTLEWCREHGLIAGHENRITPAGRAALARTGGGDG